MTHHNINVVNHLQKLLVYNFKMTRETLQNRKRGTSHHLKYYMHWSTQNENSMAQHHAKKENVLYSYVFSCSDLRTYINAAKYIYN